MVLAGELCDKTIWETYDYSITGLQENYKVLQGIVRMILLDANLGT